MNLSLVLMFVKVLNVRLMAVGYDALHYSKSSYLSLSDWYIICIRHSFVLSPIIP